jgi:hypothetical protein
MPAYGHQHLHSHNDYNQAEPLFLALRAGARSIEADVFYRKTKLAVGHNWWKLRKGRTLRKLYLDPLQKIFQANAGKIYRKDPDPLILQVDFKNASPKAIAFLQKTLQKYHGMLTRFHKGGKEQGAITIVLTGVNQYRQKIIQQEERWMAVYAELKDTTKTAAEQQRAMPLIAFKWDRYFNWDGRGRMPAEEYARLRELVQAVHRSGRKLRVWSAPDTPQCWRIQRKAGVDLVNTDRPAALSDWLDNYEGRR